MILSAALAAASLCTKSELENCKAHANGGLLNFKRASRTALVVSSQFVQFELHPRKWITSWMEVNWSTCSMLPTPLIYAVRYWFSGPPPKVFTFSPNRRKFPFCRRITISNSMLGLKNMGALIIDHERNFPQFISKSGESRSSGTSTKDEKLISTRKQPIESRRHHFPARHVERNSFRLNLIIIIFTAKITIITCTLNEHHLHKLQFVWFGGSSQPQSTNWI